MNYKIKLGVIIDYEVRSLGELWRLESRDKPRCHEDDAFISRTSIESIHVRLVECG